MNEKITAAAAAIEQAQQAVGATSVDDCPNRDEIAAKLTAAYEAVADAQRLAQG